jgi:dihydrofolate reductase
MMRTLIYSMPASLDGYIAGPDGAGLPPPDDELHRFHNDQARALGLHLLGRRLYEVMRYWETAEQRDPSLPEAQLEFARLWRELPKIVYSKTLEAVEGEKATLSHGDPVEEVRELKEQSGADIAVGGAELAATLTAHGLIDEYHLFATPVILGGGKPLFGGDTPVGVELLESRTFGSGVVYMRYRRT